jgi:hypothetical protein
MIDHRRSRRKRAQSLIEVGDAMTGLVVGHVGNLSVDGMMLIGQHAMPEDALFQFAFVLPAAAGAPAHKVELGMHEQWSEPAAGGGQYWTGFRIIDIDAATQKMLEHWVNR